MSPTLRQRPSKVDTEIGELNSDGSYAYSPIKTTIQLDSNPDNDVTPGDRLMRVFQKQLKQKVQSSTTGLHKPAWGKHVPKAQVEIDEAERIKSKKKFDKASLLYNVDPEKLPLSILERKLQTKEGNDTYDETNKVILGMKKYLKSKELIEADNKKTAKLQAE